MQTIDPDSAFSLSVHAKLKVDPSRQSTFLVVPEKAIKLNDTAVSILKACNGKNTYLQIIENLQQEYGTIKIKDDVTEFLQDMISKGWVVVERSQR